MAMPGEAASSERESCRDPGGPVGSAAEESGPERSSQESSVREFWEGVERELRGVRWDELAEFLTADRLPYALPDGFRARLQARLRPWLREVAAAHCAD